MTSCLIMVFQPPCQRQIEAYEQVVANPARGNCQRMSTMPRIFRRFIYFGYYLRETDWKVLSNYLSHLHQYGGYSRSRLLSDAVYSSFRYNIGLIDFFEFRFFELDASERERWAGTGFMYEFHRKMNPVDQRDVLHDKLRFLQAYAPFIRHPHCVVRDVEEDSSSFQELLAASPDKIVLKDAMGKCGWGVDVVDATMDRKALLKHMQQRGYNLVEGYVQQHPELAEMSPSGLNTVRMVTLVDKNNEVHILGAILRMSINSFVDNIAMGNIAAPIDVETGKLLSEGVYKDITKPPESEHPVTGKQIIGFQVPHWQEVVSMTRKAALHDLSNRSIGWDVAITESGPSLIEGNHNWCKFLWQLPYQRGLKHRILEFY